MTVYHYVFIYFAVISVTAVLLTVYDKSVSCMGHTRRISERTLFFVAAFGGALAMYITMRVIHHKTRHKRFMFGLPITFLLHVLLFSAVYFLLLKS